MAFHRGVKLRPKLEMELFSFVGRANNRDPIFLATGFWMVHEAALSQTSGLNAAPYTS